MTTTAAHQTTGTVHYAKTDGTGLVQTCGVKANQTVYLYEVDAAVTCKRCLAAGAPVAKAATPARRSYGRQEWSLGELREAAKSLGLKGYSKLDGDALLAAVVEVAPQYS